MNVLKGIFICILQLNKVLLLILFSVFTESALAAQQNIMVSESALDEATQKAVYGTAQKPTSESIPLSQAKGLITLDYEVIPVPGNKIDLLGLHYLHQLNSWLYMGLGVHAPLMYGNYGGFMAFDATIHAQQKIFGDLFIDVGASFGGGGGGSSIKQSRALSGTGGFIKSYAGLGYDFSSFSAGVNYTHFRFMNSQINHSQVNFFMQKPVSFSVGSYAAAGQTVESDFSQIGRAHV